MPRPRDGLEWTSNYPSRSPHPSVRTAADRAVHRPSCRADGSPTTRRLKVRRIVATPKEKRRTLALATDWRGPYVRIRGHSDEFHHAVLSVSLATSLPDGKSSLRSRHAVTAGSDATKQPRRGYAGRVALALRARRTPHTADDKSRTGCIGVAHRSGVEMQNSSITGVYSASSGS